MKWFLIFAICIVFFVACDVGYGKYINKIKEQASSMGTPDMTNEEYFQLVVGVHGDMNWKAFESSDALIVVELTITIPGYSEWEKSTIQWKINPKTMASELGYIGFDGEGVSWLEAPWLWAAATLRDL